MAWIKEIKAKEAGTPILQFEHSYAGDRHPFGFPDFLESSWHPQLGMLNLKFSHAGEWVKIPIEQGDTRGPDNPSFHIGRLERYIDTAGIVRKALTFGKDAKMMKTWYSFDEVKKVLGVWVIPEVPFWYNNRKWNNRLRNEHTTKKKNKQ